MRFLLFCRVLAVSLLLGSCQVLWAESRPIQVENLPGVDPLPSPETTTNEEQLENFFAQQKRGTPLQLTLDNGRVVRGLFSSYDDYYETVWLVPQGEKGVFNQKGFKLTGVRSVALWDRKATAVKGSTTPKEAVSDDYYLLKESGIK